MLNNHVMRNVVDKWVVFSLVLFLVLVTGSTNTARAGDDNKTNSTPPTILTVKKVDGQLALRHYIDIGVPELSEWSKVKGNDPTKFVLYIDGVPLEGVVAQPIFDDSVLRFNLNADFKKQNWNSIVSGHLKQFLTEPKVSLPLTIKQDGVATTSKETVNLMIIDSFGTWLTIFVIVFLIAIALFLWLAIKSDILRDTGPQPDGKNEKGKANRKPFSLARTQMAFWTFAILVAFIFIWMLTSDLPSLTTGVLGLMGISAATGLGAAVVDSGKKSDQDNERRVLEDKKTQAQADADKLSAEITALQASVNTSPPPSDLDQKNAAIAAKQTEFTAKQAEIKASDEALTKNADANKVRPSKGFINDILSDDDGVSFHRFQIFAWTLVLILIFLAKVYHQFSMPEFEGTLLALMGISAGTYIGFKLPNQPG